MEQFLNQSLAEFARLLLIICRISGLFFFAPVFGSADVPRKVKAGIILIISVLLASARPMMPLPDIQSWTFFLLLPKEIIAGSIIGFAAGLIFAGVQMSGNLIGLQMGFRYGSMVDPNSGEEVSLVGQFQYLLAALIFVLLGGYRWVLQGLATSYSMLPAGQITFTPGLETKLIQMVGSIFVVAIQVSAPVLISLLLASFALGILSRTMPQMNVINVGFILKISFGLLVLALSLDYFGDLMVHLFKIYRRDVMVLWNLFS